MHADADRLEEHPNRLADFPLRKGLREAALARLIGSLSTGQLTIIMPDGRRLLVHGARPGPEAVLDMHRGRALHRLLLGGSLGFADAYIDGDWSSPDLPTLIECIACNLPALSTRLTALAPIRIANRLRHALRRNSKSGSRRNIAFHYDLGNDFYRLWLDKGMSYSSAIALAPGETLEEAQAARQSVIIDALDLTTGMSVLEIGCGWGGLAAALARRGALVTGITLSREQLAYGQAMLAEAGDEATSVKLRLQDYRDIDERFDRIVSIEMLEAVGEAYWPVYFAKLRACLKEGGRAVLQVITIAEDRFDTYRHNTDFIQRHIFPGGMLPTRRHIAEQATKAGLTLTQSRQFGRGYAATLAEWRRRFHAARDPVEALGFGPAFHRLWDYYLAYCEGGFRAGAIDVGLYTLEG